MVDPDMERKDTEIDDEIRLSCRRIWQWERGRWWRLRNSGRFGRWWWRGACHWWLIISWFCKSLSGQGCRLTTCHWRLLGAASDIRGLPGSESSRMHDCENQLLGRVRKLLYRNPNMHTRRTLTCPVIKITHLVSNSRCLPKLVVHYKYSTEAHLRIFLFSTIVR